jgi:P4 family phage/plasmid primase-like protien
LTDFIAHAPKEPTIDNGNGKDKAGAKNQLRELAWNIASKLIDNNTFVTLAEGRSREIYRYDPEQGIYVPDGESFMKSQIQKTVSKEEISTHLVNEVIAHVERSTIKPRAIFEEHNPHLVLQNCLLNLNDLQMEEFTNGYYALNKMPVAYDQSKDCLTFKKFISEILSPEDIQGVQEELGAILYKKYMTKKLSIYVGGTDTGKTTLIIVFSTLLGLENVSSLSIQELASKNPFFLAQLYGKMANIRDDVSKDIISSVGKLKELTGGYQVNGQKKFKDLFNFLNYAYLIFTCNYLPPIEEDDEAFFNRVMIRHFNKRFGGKVKPDRELVKKLTTPDELSGILNWALEGLKRLRDNGWNFSNTVSSDATREEYKRQSDPVWAFSADCLDPDTEGVITKERSYNAFKEYCIKNSIPLISKDTFFKTIPEKVNVNSGHRNVDGEEGKKHCFIGIRLKEAYRDYGLNGKKGVPPVPPVPADSKQATLAQPEQPEQGATNLRDTKEGGPE